MSEKRSERLGEIAGGLEPFVHPDPAPDQSSRRGHLQDQHFDHADPAGLPSFVRRYPDAERAAWCEAETARQRTVATCLAPGCGRQLRDGEQIPHNLAHATNGRVRSAAGTLLALKPHEAKEAVALALLLLDEVK